MDHFGTAIAVIAATVIGGAFVVDHEVKNKDSDSVKTAAVSQAPTPAPT